MFYIGVNNGGVWKTTDAGRMWTPIFDDQPTGSIGASPSRRPTRIDLRRQRRRVAAARPVGRRRHLQVHRRRQDLDSTRPARRPADRRGHRRSAATRTACSSPCSATPTAPNDERGVFRSTDGGKTWEKVLYKDENTGAHRLAFDPTNPQTVYAVLWAARQGPWENGDAGRARAAGCSSRPTAGRPGSS